MVENELSGWIIRGGTMQSSLEEQSAAVRVAMGKVELALVELRKTERVLGECQYFPGKTKLEEAVDSYRGGLDAIVLATVSKLGAALARWDDRSPAEMDEVMKNRPTWEVNLDWGDELRTPPSDDGEVVS